MGREGAKSQKWAAPVSLWALLARSSFYKILAAVLLLAAAEIAYAYVVIRREGGAVSLEALAARFLYVFFLVSLGTVYFLLIWTERRMDTDSRYTLLRLRTGGRSQFLIRAAYNVLCLVLLYGVHVWLAIGIAWLYGRSLEPGQASPQLLFLAFYRIGFFHGLLPLAETGKWIRNVLLVLALGMAAAGGMDRKDRVAQMLLLAVGAGCFASPVGLYFPDVLCCIVSAVEIALGLREGH